MPLAEGLVKIFASPAENMRPLIRLNGSELQLITLTVKAGESLERKLCSNGNKLLSAYISEMLQLLLPSSSKHSACGFPAGSGHMISGWAEVCLLVFRKLPTSNYQSSLPYSFHDEIWRKTTAFSSTFSNFSQTTHV